MLEGPPGRHHRLAAAHDGRAHLPLRHHACATARRPRASTSRSPTSCRIARELDALGIDYVEGGWPGANPTDDAFFAQSRRSSGSAKLCAFGMTRRSGRSAANDPGLVGLFQAQHARDHAGRQELGPAGRRGARRQPRREPAHDRGFDPRGPAPRRRGDVRRRALLRRLQGGRRLRAGLPARRRTRPVRAGSCCATPMAARCRTRSRRSSARVHEPHPGRAAGHPHPQRYRERGRQQPGGRSAPGPGRCRAR